MNKPRAFCEFPAGLAAVSLYLHGGKHCRPPISRQGAKTGYAEVILATLGLRSGSGADCYVWAESDPDVRALLRAYPDADMLRRIAEIIRSWADEEPRALWERLRAERKARGAVSPDEGSVANWIQQGVWSYRQGDLTSGGPVLPGDRRQDTTATATATARIAEYATIASANRLIHVSGPDLMNTGKGGTTFGGENFATPAADVAGGFERVAGWCAEAVRTMPQAQARGSTDGDFMPRVAPSGVVRYQQDSPATGILKLQSSRWPPVAVLPTLPDAATLSAMLGTPGDLEGVVVYSDPDYRGTTGYASTCRDMIPGLALGWSAMGAVVCVSEAVPVPELTVHGWHSVDIAAGRKGQARTFARVATESLTLNRPPAYTISQQARLFT